jgi:hypothetical protein
MAATATAAALAPRPTRGAEPGAAAIVDTNVWLGPWPFRHLALAEPAGLVARLRALEVTQAWAGSFEALLHKDVSSVNARLADRCARQGGGLLVPFGALNPMLAGWEEDLRRCAELHRMPGIRLHPNYHGYKLDEPIFEQVLRAAAERGLLVQIAAIMEDDRTLHPLVAVPPTDLTPLAATLEKVPAARVQLLNALRFLRGVPLLALASRGVSFDCAMLEGVAGLETLLEKLPAERLCFGSHAPFFYPEAAKLKLQESALSAEQRRAVCEMNARRLLTRA